MHGFNLGLESVMAGHFAKTIAVQAQQVATFIRASPPAAAAVAKAAELERLSGRVLSGNGTRFTSVIRMLESLQSLRPALVRAVGEQPAVFKQSVRTLLGSRDFWEDIAALLPILQPFAVAIMSIQRLDATLADVLLHWLRLAAAMRRNLPGVPRGMTHSHWHV